MSDDSALTQEVGPEVVAEAHEAEGQVQDQTTEGAPASPEEEAKLNETQKRRARRKAEVLRLREAAQASAYEARQAGERHQKIIDTGARFAEPTEATHPDPMDLAAARAVWHHNKQARQHDEASAKEAADAAERQAQETATQAQHVANAEWAEAVTEAKERYADFNVVALNPEVPVSPIMAELIRMNDAGPDILYHLGLHPDEAGRIAQMPPAIAAMEIGRISASLSTPRPKTATTAPAPISPVKGGVGAGKRPSEMSPTEYRQWRESGGKF